MTTLDNLRKAAKRWLKALRDGDADARARYARAYPDGRDAPALRDVQHALARERGFENWRAMTMAVGGGNGPDASLVEDEREAIERSFLEHACWDHHLHGLGYYARRQATAARLLRKHPDIAHYSLYTAIVCGDVAEVERRLDARPSLAVEKGGARGWEPLLYVCYGRVPTGPASDHAVAIARALLDRGADPNAYYMAGDAVYSALVGVAGEGEQDAPPHPNREALYRLLLERGAGPYDIQVLYNTSFHGRVFWWLNLTYEHTARTGRQADWANPDWPMLDMGGYGSGARYLLSRIAIAHDDLPLAEWLLARGANPNAAPPRGRGQSKRSLHEEAVRRGATAIADLLVRHGAQASTVVLEDDELFVAACFRLDRDEIARRLANHPEYLRSSRAIFAAAERNRADVVALLLDLGVPIEIQDGQRQRAMHSAAGAHALDVARLLIERGAEVDPVEANWGATPLGYAVYGNDQSMIDLLSRHSRDVWHLALTGNVARLRDLLREDPSLARRANDRGITLLWWLPADEDRALEILDLLIAHGADPTAASQAGGTAADAARAAGLDRVAERIEHSGGRLAADAVSTPGTTAQSPDLDRFDRLARDLVVAHESGEPGALRRLEGHYGRALTQQDVRSAVRGRVHAVRHSAGPVHYFDLADARDLIARDAGHGNWTAFAKALAGGRGPAGTGYVTDAGASRVRPCRVLVGQEWDDFIETIGEHRIAAVDGGGQMTDAALERISTFDHVTALHLEGSRQVTDAGLRHLARMPQLERVNLSGCAITDRGLEVLRMLPRLRSFELYHHPAIGDLGVSHLEDCHLLERVALMGTRTGDRAFQALMRKPHLRFFQAGTLFSEQGLSLLHEFPAFAAWQGGELQYGLMDFEAAPTCVLLHPAAPLAPNALHTLAGLDGLFALNLDNPAWRGADLAPLRRLANLGWLGYDADDTSMAEISSLPKLRFLMCQDTEAGDEGFAALSRSPTIEYIWGRRCYNLGSRGFTALSRMPALRGLAVSCRNVDDVALSHLPQFPSLREFMPMDVPDQGFRHVGRCEQLEALWCMYCRDTSDAATDHIAGLHLRIYYAGQTRITDRSLELLGRMDSLEDVRLWNCAGITDAGLAALARLPRLRAVALHSLSGVTLQGSTVFPPHVHVDYSVH